MRKAWEFISSTKTSLVLLIIFTLAMAVATFVENSYDTLTAKQLVYNSRWFELVMILMAVNFLGNIKKYNLWSLEKAPGFLFHFAFVLIIVASGITRYFGFEGNMRIREGEESSVFYSSEPHLMIYVKDSSGTYSHEKPYNFSPLFNESVEVEFETSAGKINVEYADYIPNATETIVQNFVDGTTIIELTVSTPDITEKFYIKDGEVVIAGNTSFAFNASGAADAVKITGLPGKLNINFPSEAVKYFMSIAEVIPANTVSEFNEGHGYEISGLRFYISNLFINSKKKLIPGNPNEQLPDALVLNLEAGNKKEEMIIWGGPEYTAKFQEVYLNGIKIQAGYGPKEMQLPFALELNDFILERYPGSNSPSSFESVVTLKDSRKNLNEKHRIFMNNVLDYDGYRFFQSSYDSDELGTVLSVNKDFWGTWLTYLSYILLGIGFLLTLVNKNSRFIALTRLIRSIHVQRNSLTVMLLFPGSVALAQIPAPVNKNVDKVHADKFSRLIVQGFEGRFQPVHTLAYDVMHKISRKDNFEFEGEKMNAVQVFLNLLLNPELWKQKKIIYVREQAVRDFLKIDESYASFDDFFDQQGEYKIQKHVEEAFRKKQSAQNKFDKEIIKVDERLNIVVMVMKGEFLKIFPDPGSANNRWISWNDKEAQNILEGNINSLNDELMLPLFNYSNLFRLYYTELTYAANSGNYQRAEKILNHIKGIQRQLAPSDLLPSEKMIDFEIHYNELNIFSNLKNFYGLLSIILLLLAFMDNLKAGKKKGLKLFLNIFIAFSVLAFVVHTYGMGLRWYLTGHAPWSNGYETLVLAGWSGMLAGICFLRYSKITVAATVLLAFFTLMTAGHSSYDPQLTNLVPVLKSYWLIFHVAALVISYGFFGLSFILALITLILIIITNKNNFKRNVSLIKEWTFINEMNLTIGLILATIGTFLGGVWANESWGRYWGWDAKETWALIIIIVYSTILHLRLVPRLRGEFIFNASALIGFGSVLMTFFGVNYYFTKGLHSYASGETPVFPLWGWITIFLLVLLIVFAGVKTAFNKAFFEN